MENKINNIIELVQNMKDDNSTTNEKEIENKELFHNVMSVINDFKKSA